MDATHAAPDAWGKLSPFAAKTPRAALACAILALLLSCASLLALPEAAYAEPTWTETSSGVAFEESMHSYAGHYSREYKYELSATIDGVKVIGTDPVSNYPDIAMPKGPFTVTCSGYAYKRHTDTGENWQLIDPTKAKDTAEQGMYLSIEMSCSGWQADGEWCREVVKVELPHPRDDDYRGDDDFTEIRVVRSGTGITEEEHTAAATDTRSLSYTFEVPEWTETMELRCGLNHDALPTTTSSHTRLFTVWAKGSAEVSDPGDVTVTTEAKETPGEQRDDNGWVIPLVVVLGIAGVGGVGLAARGRGKKGEPQQQQRQPSTFRMVLWKDCGDTLYLGGPESLVGARIEEVPQQGPPIDRPDLTARLTFAASQNLAARDAGFVGSCKCVAVSPTAAQPGTAVVSIAYASSDGSFTNNVNFKVDEARIAFADAALTFVAGRGQTLMMPFRFLPDSMGPAGGRSPAFEVAFTTDEAAKRFGKPRVMVDPEFPEMLDVQFAELGPSDLDADRLAGEVETYAFEVVAKVPPAAPGGREAVLRGTCPFFRFHEGVRFHMEPLKCYAVKHVQEAPDEPAEVDGERLEAAERAQLRALSMAGVAVPGGIPGTAGVKGTMADAVREVLETQHLDEGKLRVNGQEALDIAAWAQAQAMGVAGGIAGGVIAPTAKAGMREAARQVGEMFPELFAEETVYVLDRREKMRLTPARTRAYVTLYVADEFVDERGMSYVRPCTPLPRLGDIMLSFSDVEGSSPLADKNGNPKARPAEQLDFKYYVSDVKRADNTVTFEILPTKSILIPPNRALVDVAVMVKWKDRTFTAKERVAAVSQPYRMDYLQRKAEYDAIDERRTESLLKIQETILEGYTGAVAHGGGKTAGERVFDLIDDLTSERALLIETPEELAKEKADPRSLRAKEAVYCDDLMPMYHYIQGMLDGFSCEFGYSDADYKRVVRTFAKFRQGRLGSAEAVDLAYYGHDMERGDAIAEVVRGWNSSGTLVAARVALGIVTAEQSELLFLPLSAIGAGLEESVNYVDAGGDSLYEAYTVGVTRGAKAALQELAVRGGMALGAKAGGVIAREAWAQKGLIWQATKEMFATAGHGERLAVATRQMGAKIAASEKRALELISRHRGMATVGERAARDAAYRLGRELGSAKAEKLKLLADGAKLGWRERKAIVLAVQSDKHAMRYLMELPQNEANNALRAAFNKEIAQIEKDAILQTRRRIAERVGLKMENIQPAGTSGNAAGDVALGKKVSMDLDVTFRYKVESTGEWIDIDASRCQEIYNQEFFRVVKGFYAESQGVADTFTTLADQTVTDFLHPEAYSKVYADALRVVNARRAGEAFEYGETVAKVARYKCEHWLKLGRSAADEALAAMKAGDLREAEKLFAAAEAFTEEGTRQFTKQADRLIVNKIVAMQANGVQAGRVVNGVDIDVFMEKVAVLKRSGAGYFGGTGLTTAEADAVLMKGFGSTLDDVYRDLEALTLGLDDTIKAAERAATTVRQSRIL